MKKQLLCTSAIALGCAMAAPAAAQDWNVRVGGYYNQHLGYANVSGNANTGADFDGFDIFTNAEIHIKPTITLDNGLTFGAHVEFEAMNTGGARIDESYVIVSGDQLGRFLIGSENSAGYLMTVAAPGIGIGIASPSASAFIPVSTALPAGTFNFRQAMISPWVEVAGNNDVQRLTYFTPSFNGLTVGVSYARQGSFNTGSINTSPVDNNTTGVTDVFDIAVAYSQSFNGVDLDLSARWGTADSNVVGISDPEVWAIGASVGFNGFTIGGTYAENDNGGPGGVGGANGFADQEGWGLGASYDIPGPWTVAFDTWQGEQSQGVGVGKLEYTAYQLGARRSLGKGVAWQVYAVQSEGKDKAAGLTSKGTLLATSINLSF